jgi:hypothetical protein
MQQVLIVAGMFLGSITTAYIITCVKGINKEDKVEIMSVRSELRKIDKMNKADKDSLF